MAKSNTGAGSGPGSSGAGDTTTTPAAGTSGGAPASSAAAGDSGGTDQDAAPTVYDVPAGLPVVPGGGPTGEETAKEAADAGHRPGARSNATRMEGEQPGTGGHVAPGDAPHDTTDPNEMLSTVPAAGPMMADAARAGLGSVVSAVKTGEIGEWPGPDTARTEEYEVYVDRYTVQKMQRNIETGESKPVGEPRRLPGAPDVEPASARG